jgi:hypothetical protein
MWTSGQGNSLAHPTTDKNIEKVDPVKARWMAGEKAVNISRKGLNEKYTSRNNRPHLGTRDHI